jgi:two-component system invasion response regulator UvrY
MKRWNIRLLIIEDHATMRDGLKRIVAAAPEISAVGEAGDLPSGLHELREGNWDAVLVDLMLQNCTGINLIMEARAKRPTMPILALCRHGHEKCANRALRNGASGYLSANASGEELIRALRLVMHGGHYVSPGIAQQLQAQANGRAPAVAHDSLSAREYQVFRMIASGSTPTQVAKQLSLSVHTVDTYRGRVLKKMGMRTSAELVRYAIVNELVP